MTAAARVPMVYQLEAAECGAASLAMVLAHFGCWVDIETLREQCGTSRDGTNLGRLLAVAGGYGLTAKGFSREAGELTGLPLPLIAFWNFNHFIVVRRLTAGEVEVNDPAAGPLTLTMAEFTQGYSGVALAFQPSAAFRPRGRKPSVLRALAAQGRSSHGTLALVTAVSLLLVFPGLLVPAFSRVFVDYYLVQNLKDWLWPLLAGMAATAVVRMALTHLQQSFLRRLQTKLSLAASAAYLWRVLHLPVAFFAQRYAGDMANRLALTDQVAATITGPVAMTVLNLATILVYLAVMAQYDLALTGLALAFAALNLGSLYLVSVRLAEGSRRIMLNQGKLAAVAMQGLSLLEPLKAAGRETLLYARWVGAHAKVINAEQTVAQPRILLTNLPALLNGLGNAAILGFGGWRVMQGEMTLGTLVAFQALAALVNAPVAALVALGAQIQQAAGSLMRLDDVFGAQISGAVPQSPIGGRNRGAVELRELTFGYLPSAPPLLDGLSLSLPPGGRVGITGPSGCGKSTIGRLLAGMYRPWSGEVTVDGVPVLVEQDPSLFEGSVRDNITLWDDTLPEHLIVEAAQDAMIHDLIQSRPGGYDSPVREGGRDWSGGERQRIALARALVLRPAVLILDEATSALDALTEAAVLDRIRRRGCTTIVIAHGAQPLADLDEVIVIEKGCIVERRRRQTPEIQRILRRRPAKAMS